MKYRVKYSYTVDEIAYIEADNDDHAQEIAEKVIGKAGLETAVIERMEGRNSQ